MNPWKKLMKFIKPDYMLFFAFVGFVDLFSSQKQASVYDSLHFYEVCRAYEPKYIFKRFISFINHWKKRFLFYGFL